MTDIDTDLFLYLESIMFCNSFKQLYNVMHFLRKKSKQIWVRE